MVLYIGVQYFGVGRVYVQVGSVGCFVDEEGFLLGYVVVYILVYVMGFRGAMYCVLYGYVDDVWIFWMDYNSRDMVGIF